MKRSDGSRRKIEAPKAPIFWRKIDPQLPRDVWLLQIGGVLNSNCNMIIGLADQNYSGDTWIAYFEPDPDDGSQTLVSILLAEGLAEEGNGLEVTEEAEG